MKCLLCDFKSNNTSELKDHSLNFHNVDRENSFSKDYLKTRTIFFVKCVRCNEFLPTTKFKSYHVVF